MKTRRWAAALGAAAAAFGPTLGHGAEAFATYDAFDTTPMDPALWNEAERSRLVSNGALQLRMREYGSTAADSGRTGVSWGDGVARPSQLTQVRAQVTATTARVRGCAANPSTTRVRARLLGFFFNTGKPVSGSFVGDVGAQVYLVRDSDSGDPANLMRVEANAFVCAASDCNTTTSIGTTQSLGTVAVGTATTLSMEWDKAGKRFVFLRNTGETAQIGYGTLSDSLQAARPLVTLGLRTDLESCASGPVTFGDITARFDNVAVNASAD